MLVTALIAFALMPIFETPRLDHSFVFWGNILYLSLLGSVVCVYVMTRYQKDVTPTRAAILYSLEPVFSAMLAVVILKELFSPTQITGAVFILGGVLLSELLAIRRTSGAQALNPSE